MVLYLQYVIKFLNWNKFGRFKYYSYLCKRNGQNDITDVFIIKLV
jgi:hypothetical protein